jgi:hypothetical protein
MSVTLYLRHGDCTQVLATMSEGSVGAVVSDPPYGLKFMGMGWDALDGRGKDGATEIDRSRSFDRIGGNHNPTSTVDAARTRQLENQRQQKWHRAWLAECYRVLPPGGVLKAFSATRTFHRMSAAMQEAGFTDLRVEAWAYGSGFPKSMSIGKAMDKAARGVPHGGADPTSPNHGRYKGGCSADNPSGRGFGAGPGAFMAKAGVHRDPNGTVVPEDCVWEGWGTALKPSWEPVLVGRKPCAP